MSEMLVAVGNLDADDDNDVGRVLEQLRDLHAILIADMEHEIAFSIQHWRRVSQVRAPTGSIDWKVEIARIYARY